MSRYDELMAERKRMEEEALKKQKELAARKVGTDNLATLKDERLEQPQSIMARIDADIAKGREAEKVKQLKIQQEREAQEKAIATSKTPKLSDINRSAANVDYAPEIRRAELQYKTDMEAERLKNSPQAKLERLTNPDNYLNDFKAVTDTVQASAQNALLGAKRLGAGVADYTKMNQADNPFLNYIEKAKETLRQIVTQKPPVVDSTANDPINWQRDKREEYYNTGKSFQSRIDVQQQALHDKFKDVTENDVSKALYDLAGSIGYMLPVQVANAIIPKTGSALLYSAGYASGEKQALSEGASAADAKTYAILNGLNQAVVEELVGGALGATSGLTNAMLKSVGFNLAKTITNPAVRTLAKGLTNIFGEGIEEGVQNLIDVEFQKLTYNPEAKVDPKALGYDMLLGGLMGGVYGAPGMVSEYNALRLPSAQTETQPAKVTFAERNRNDLSRTITENAAQAPKTGAQTSSAQDYYNSRIADIKSRETDLFGRLRTAEEDETFNRLTTAKNNTEKSGILAGASDEVIATASRTAEAGGIDILFERMERTAAGNVIDGYEYGGKLYINPESQHTVEFIQGHELTHSIEKAKSYDKLSKYVLQRMGTEAIEAERQRIGGIRTAEGQQLTEAEIDREIVADFAGKNLLNNESDIIDIVRTDRTLAERIRDWLSGMVKQFTGTEDEKFYARARSLYVKALAEARRSDAATGKAAASVSESADIKSDAFKKWFGDWENSPDTASKVVDKDGIPLRVFHGTNADENFTMFDTYGSKYGLYGMGSYFTEDKDIAWKYTKKGRGGNPRVYETYLNIRNPLDMDAPADITAWEKAINKADIDANLSGVKTNSDVIRLIERDLTDNEYFAWEGADIMTGIIQGMGYDGITHIGGNIRGDKEHRVWIAYEPEQIKSATSNIGTYDAKNPDIRYSVSKADDESYMTAVNNGDTETAQKMVDEAAKKAGYNVKAYHGSKSTFTVFSETLRGTNQTTEAGKRYFFAGDRETAESYSPYHVLKNLAETMPKMFQMKDADAVKGRGGVLDLYISMKSPLEADLIDYNWAAHFEKRDALMEYIEQAEANGNDGLIFHHVPDNLMQPGKRVSTIYLFKNPSQAKSADPITYDDNGEVIPLSKRFDASNNDIRYSISKDADYFRKRANATKAINATTQDADTWQAPPKTRRAVPIEATITADERAGEAALTAHKTLQQIIDEIDSRYEQQAEIATQQAREHLDRIIEQENAKHIEIPGVPVSETAEAEAAEARELTLPYVMADEDAKDNVKKVSAEENQSIALITEAEALLKPADPLQADMEAYKKAKKDYRATVQGNKTNPGMVTDADVLASAEQVSKARDNVLKKIEKREAAMKHALDNGTFAEVMLKQYEQLKQMKKAARNTKNPEAQAKAQKQAEQKQAYIFDINRRRKALLYKQAEETMGPLEAWTDKSIGLKYQRETFERNIRDIAPNKTIAERVNKEYRWVIDKNEAKRNKYRRDYNERVKALNMSDKVLPGNEVSERYAVQFVGEADYLIYISTAKKDRFAKTRADYQQDLNDFMAKNPNFNYEAIREKVKTMRGIYNAIYIDINKARVENGYEPVEYRKGYFPHFSEHKPDTLLSKLAATFGINTAPDSLPTSINGLTYQFRPGTRWFGNILRRSSNTTDYDAEKGFDRYILGASDVIFHTEDIQRLRAMSNYIREYGSDKRLQDQAKLIRADDTKTAEQQQEAIASLFREANHVLGNFVVDLDEYTNQLANKKPRKDRDTEYDFGRKAYNILQSVENRIAGNMVAVNPRTWLTNFIPIHQAAARISNKNMIYGALSAVKATIESDALSDASDFLVNRRGVDPLVMSFSQKAGDVLSKPMTWIDNYAAETIVRARYLDNMEKGMPHANAIDEAGAFATGIMAGRSKGAAPTLFSAKNPATKVFTMFQLEVNNQLSALLKDLPDEKRDEGVAALAMAFIKFIVGAYLFNDLFEWIIGARPGLDVAGVANEAVGDFTGYQLPNTFEFAADLIKERRLPELADFETTKKTTNAAGISTAKNIAEELPFIGGVLGGGRVPISAAGFDLGKIWSAGSGIKDGTVDSNKALATIGKELSNPLFYLALPFGGGQIKKIYQGVDAVNQGGSWTLDSDGDRVLQYPVFDKNPLTYARAALFGKTSLPTAQDWIDNDFKRLSASASATYAALTNMKQDPEEAYNAVMDIAKSEKTDTQSKASIQRNKIAGYPIAGSMKYEMYYNMVASDSDKRIMDELTKANLNEGAAFSVIDKYKDLNESKAKAGEKALDWQHWVDKQGFTDKQKSIIDENIGFRVAMPVEPSTYEKLTASGMEADAAYQIAEAFNKLKPLEGETGVSEYQKYHAINEMDLEQKVKLAAYRAIMEKERYMKLADAVIAGTPLKLYIEYIDKVRGIKSDLQDGETVPDSKKQKVLSYINFLPITKKAKDKLYEQAGYRESTISDAPWRGGAKYSGDMFGLKVNGRQLG